MRGAADRLPPPMAILPVGHVAVAEMPAVDTLTTVALAMLPPAGPAGPVSSFWPCGPWAQ